MSFNFICEEFKMAVRNSQYPVYASMGPSGSVLASKSEVSVDSRILVILSLILEGKEVVTERFEKAKVVLYEQFRSLESLAELVNTLVCKSVSLNTGVKCKLRTLFMPDCGEVSLEKISFFTYKAVPLNQRFPPLELSITKILWRVILLDSQISIREFASYLCMDADPGLNLRETN